MRSVLIFDVRLVLFIFPIVDVIGVVLDVSDLQSGRNEDKNFDWKKRNVLLVDSTGFSVVVILWGDNVNFFLARVLSLFLHVLPICLMFQAELFNEGYKKTVVAIKNLKIEKKQNNSKI